MIDLVQWPAMVVILIASWLVGSQRPKRRMIAFVAFILGNLLWITWGLYAEAYALVLLDASLCVTNIRGFLKNRSAATPE